MKATTLKAIVGFVQYRISSIKWVYRTLDSLDTCWLHEEMVNLMKSLISKAEENRILNLEEGELRI